MDRGGRSLPPPAPLPPPPAPRLPAPFWSGARFARAKFPLFSLPPFLPPLSLLPPLFSLLLFSLLPPPLLPLPPLHPPSLLPRPPPLIWQVTFTLWKIAKSLLMSILYCVLIRSFENKYLLQIVKNIALKIKHRFYYLLFNIHAGMNTLTCSSQIHVSIIY